MTVRWRSLWKSIRKLFFTKCHVARNKIFFCGEIVDVPPPSSQMDSLQKRTIDLVLQIYLCLETRSEHNKDTQRYENSHNRAAFETKAHRASSRLITLSPEFDGKISLKIKSSRHVNNMPVISFDAFVLLRCAYARGLV